MKITFDFLITPDKYLHEFNMDVNECYSRFNTCSKCIYCEFADELIFHIICNKDDVDWHDCFKKKIKD
jgi:hypothetical protein